MAAEQDAKMPQDATLQQACLITGACNQPVRGEEVSLVRLLRALCPFCPGIKPSWGNGLCSENPSQVSPQCVRTPEATGSHC